MENLTLNTHLKPKHSFFKNIAIIGTISASIFFSNMVFSESETNTTASKKASSETRYEKMSEKRLDRLSKKLDLSEEQQASLKPLLKQQHEERKKVLKPLQEKHQAELGKVLNKEQMEKLKQMKKPKHKKMKKKQKSY